MPPSLESVTLPRGFRFRYQDGERPKTPETTLVCEPQQPSPPRGARLKIKRRNVSQFSGPTEQFLASVAAADIPIPTIEIPITTEDVDMIDPNTSSDNGSGLLVPNDTILNRTYPQTPEPQFVNPTNEAQVNRRDWYMDATSTPDSGLIRPSSSLSNPSDWSEDSYFSFGRMSRPSADSNCTSPDEALVDPFITFLKDRGNDITLLHDPNSTSSEILNAQLRSKSRNDAPWSKEMSDHLWHIYQVYLQDPTVTPFRIGASAVPPEGVIYRVAREAKRSWKGPKSPADRHLNKHRVLTPSINPSMCIMEDALSPTTTAGMSKSGSITPTDQTVPKVYISWQHSSAATRTHLRELCKRKDSLSVQKHRHLQSRSPTPFSNSRVLPKGPLLSPPPATRGAFSTKDIAMSLTTSTSATMQPDGLLAKLGGSSGPSTDFLRPENRNEFKLPKAPSGGTFGSGPALSRLKSPFTSRTYGPSTSNSFSTFSKPSSPNSRYDNGSATGPRLRSPLRFKPSRSLNGTQKRRAQYALEDELSPNGGVLRPSILDEQVFGGQIENPHRRVRLRGFSLGDATSRNRIPELFRAQAHGMTNLSHPSIESTDPPRRVTPLLPSAEFSQPRRRSPFLQDGTSNTYPKRLTQPMEGSSTIRARQFATVHHTRHSIESYDFSKGPILQSRLTQLDEKLTELRQRDATYSKPSDNN